jgi:hypothetical protein
MSKKVIYVAWIKLTDKYARDWYIDHLIQNGIEVEYWDVSALTREQHNEAAELDVNYLRVLKSYGEFEHLVQREENKGVIYVMLMDPCWKTRRPYRLLSKYNCKMVYIAWGAMPVLAVPKLQKALSKLILHPFEFFGLLFTMMGWLVYKKLKLINQFYIVFAAGSVITKSDQFAKKVVPFNLCDYDNYMRVKESNKLLVNGKYAVFLDINLPHQSDLALSGLVAVNANNYYQSLNRFFSRLEQQYGIKIVIAAHPKTSADATVFGQREIYRLCTAELVKDADFVITHTSTALSYVALNFKPCIFIYTGEMDALYRTSVIKQMRAQAIYLDSPMYNIDQIADGSQVALKAPNNINYDDYRYSFLTSKESENSSGKDIFLSEINAVSSI